MSEGAGHDHGDAGARRDQGDAGAGLGRSDEAAGHGRGDEAAGLGRGDACTDRDQGDAGAGLGRGDAVDVIIGQWRRERPDLDLSAMGVFGRIALLTAVLGPAVEQVYERHGLRRGEFDVLAALRRSGPPYTLIPSKLSAALMMSRAGMTSRLDRLEEAGLVERRLDPDDRRSFLVTLTERGRAVIDATLTEHAANLARLISPLTPAETLTLERALKTLLQGTTSAPSA